MNTQTTEKTTEKTTELSLRVEYGWFSPKSKARGNKTHIYLTGTGDEVEVSFVTQSANYVPGWDDTVHVGKVFRYVKSIENTMAFQKRR